MTLNQHDGVQAQRGRAAHPNWETTTHVSVTWGVVSSGELMMHMAVGTVLNDTALDIVYLGRISYTVL